MDLSLIYTLVLVGIIVIGGIIGIALGGIKMLFRLVGSILCLIAALFIAQSIGNVIYESMLQDKVHIAVGEAIVKVSEQIDGITANVNETVDVEKAVEDIQGVKDNVLSNYDIEIDLENIDIEGMLKSLQAEADNDILASALGLLTDNVDAIQGVIEEMKNSDKTVEDYICEDIVDPIGIMLVKIIVFLVLFMLLKIIVTVIIGLLDKLVENSAISGVNRFIGLCIGLVCGLIISYIVAVGIGMLSDMNIKTEYFNRQYLERSVVGNMLITFDVSEFYTDASTWYQEVLEQGSITDKNEVTSS